MTPVTVAPGGLLGATRELAARGLDPRVHARAVGGPGQVGHRADELVALASVFKIPVLVELCRRTADGRLDPLQRVRVTPAQRTAGPTGISSLLDEVEVSLRDLAVLMMSVSDNTATDVVMGLLGADAVGAINATLAELGAEETVLVGDCRLVLDTLARDLGAPSSEELIAFLGGLSPEEHLAATARMRTSSAVEPGSTNRSTAAGITRLLALIWSDRAGSPAACAEMRRVMGLQVWPHRLRAGFPESVAVAGKTGTLPHWRNEAGVVSYPDGGRYAVAVFLGSDDAHQLDPDADRAVGDLARAAVEELRAAEGRG